MGLIRKGLAAAGYGVAAAALVSGLVWAAGNYSNWPIVAGASYCAAIVGSSNVQSGATGQGTGTTTGVNGVYCAQTVPAGPPSLTGAEVFPLDTRQAGTVASGPQQSALVTAQQLGVGYTYVAAANVTGTLNIPAATAIEVLDPTATVSSLTLTMPQNPIDGQFLRIASTKTITTFTLVAGADNYFINETPTILTLSTTGAYNYEFMFNAANTTWYRLQ
jgi:hypothetical protein